MERSGEDYHLPECSTPFLVERLLEIGPVLAGPMGSAAFSWRDLQAWQECTGIQLPPWQARMLVDLSREYAAFIQTAEKQDCPPPWSEPPLTEDKRISISRSLRIGFAALMSRGK
jgi:hypothetical protein